MVFALIAAGVVLVIFYGIYVSLIKKKNNLKEAAAGIDVQLKKRYDLIPNLLKSAAKFMEHEKDVFMKVTELREKAMGAGSFEDRFKAENALGIPAPGKADLSRNSQPVAVRAPGARLLPRHCEHTPFCR